MYYTVKLNVGELKSLKRQICVNTNSVMLIKWLLLIISAAISWDQTLHVKNAKIILSVTLWQ